MARQIVSVLALALLAGCKSRAEVSEDTISQSEALAPKAPDVQDGAPGVAELKPEPDDVLQQLGATTDIIDSGLSNNADSRDHGEAQAKTALGPAWTRGEMEKPLGTKVMDGWTEATYTSEQQLQLGVDEQGNPREEPKAEGQSKAPEAEEAERLRSNYKLESPEEQQAKAPEAESLAEEVEEAPAAALATQLESAKQLCQLLGVQFAKTSKTLQHQISQTGENLVKAARQHCSKERLAMTGAALQESLQCFTWPAAAAAAATAASTVAAIAAAAEAAAATAAAKAAIEAATTASASEPLYLQRCISQLINTGTKCERFISERATAIKSVAAQRAKARKAAVKRYLANTGTTIQHGIGLARQQLASTGATLQHHMADQLWGTGSKLQHFLVQKATAAKTAHAVRKLAKKAMEEKEAAEQAAAAEAETVGEAKTMRAEAKKAAAQRAAEAKALSKKTDLQKELEERLAQLEVSFDFMLTICQVLVISVVGCCLSQAFGAFFSWEAYKLSKDLAGFLGIGRAVAPERPPRAPPVVREPRVREPRVREPREPKLPRVPRQDRQAKKLYKIAKQAGPPSSHFPSAQEMGHFNL